MFKKRGEIWVSFVLYVLISLAVLSMIFAAIKPRIDEAQDKAIVEQTVIMFNDLNEAVKTASLSSGTVIKRELKITKGDLFIYNMTNTNANINNGSIQFIIYDTSLKYSEVNVPLSIGDIKILTQETKSKDKYNINLTMTFKDKQIFVGDGDKEFKQFISSPVNYRLFIKNEGDNVIRIYES